MAQQKSIHLQVIYNVLDMSNTPMCNTPSSGSVNELM